MHVASAQTRAKILDSSETVTHEGNGIQAGSKAEISVVTKFNEWLALPTSAFVQVITWGDPEM